MTKQKINSREYKVMLIRDRFNGSLDEVNNCAQEFWGAFSDVIKDIATASDDKFEVDKKRFIRFFDTEDHLLYDKHEYVFRERTEDEEREVTLKFRHRDRYVSQARDMRGKDGEDDNMKFEQDVKPPLFVSLYSYSNKKKIKPSKNLNKLNDVGRLFPDFKLRLGDDYVGKRELKVVNDFTAYEIVLDGPRFLIDEEIQLECECALIVWYDKEFNGEPIVAEFSFKYRDESGKEAFGDEVAQVAFDVFQLLQEDEKLAGWVDLGGTTKTRFAYKYPEG